MAVLTVGALMVSPLSCISCAYGTPNTPGPETPIFRVLDPLRGPGARQNSPSPPAPPETIQLRIAATGSRTVDTVHTTKDAHVHCGSVGPPLLGPPLAPQLPGCVCVCVGGGGGGGALTPAHRSPHQHPTDGVNRKSDTKDPGSVTLTLTVCPVPGAACFTPRSG